MEKKMSMPVTADDLPVVVANHRGIDRLTPATWAEIDAFRATEMDCMAQSKRTRIVQLSILILWILHLFNPWVNGSSQLISSMFLVPPLAFGIAIPGLKLQKTEKNLDAAARGIFGKKVSDFSLSEENDALDTMRLSADIRKSLDMLTQSGQPIPEWIVHVKTDLSRMHSILRDPDRRYRSTERAPILSKLVEAADSLRTAVRQS